MLDNSHVIQLVEFPYNVFADAQVATGVFVFAKGEAKKKARVSIIRARQVGNSALFGLIREIPQTAYRRSFQNVFDRSIGPDNRINQG